MLEDIDPNRIADPQARQAIVLLLNLVEQQSQQLHLLKEENQRLRDEIARLKGQQGKPSIKPNKPAPSDHSSEKERKQPKARTPRSKTQHIKIDRTVFPEIDLSQLPADVEFKGYEDYIVQDLKLVTDNVCFRRARFYSPSTGKSYLAPLPEGYDSHFGPEIKPLALHLAYAANMSQAGIRNLFVSAGIDISSGQVSNLLVSGQEALHTESDAVFIAGLESSAWQHIDDTATRVNGDNQHCHVVCNPLYSAYRTLPGKDRLSVLSVLCNQAPLSFVCNANALCYMQVQGLSKKLRHRLTALLPQDTRMSEPELLSLLCTHLPHLGPKQKKSVLEGMAIAAYQSASDFPVVDLLVCDDAPQFLYLTCELGLCWVHDARHYAKLMPRMAHHAKILEEFRKDYWTYYKALLAYRDKPDEEEANRLCEEFDTLFTPDTGYEALDERIKKTAANKANLLMVLEHPEIPLHNNPAELAARRRVRKRDVSFGPRSEDGKKAWDTFMTLSATATKLGVNFLHYLQDRLSGKKAMPSLADLIKERAEHLELDASWNLV